MNLRCDLNDGFYISVRKPIDGSEKQWNQNYLLDLFEKTNKKPIATKSVPWPSNEESPSELLFESNEGVVKLKNSTTLAEIPLRLQNISNRKEDSSYCKRISSFSSNVPDNTSNELIANSVKTVIQSPTSKTSWKELIEILVSNRSADTLPVIEQDELIQALSQNHNSKLFHEICIALRNSNILGKQQELALFCIEKDQINVVIGGLLTKNYSEKIKVKILSHITSLLSCEASNVLETLLRSGFSHEQMLIEAKVLTSKETSILLNLLSEIFANIEKSDIHSQTLSLVSVLIDATGPQLIVEVETQKTIRELMFLINDYASLTDVFSKFEVMSTIHDSTSVDSDIQYRLRRLQIKPRKIVW